MRARRAIDAAGSRGLGRLVGHACSALASSEERERREREKSLDFGNGGEVETGDRRETNADLYF